MSNRLEKIGARIKVLRIEAGYTSYEKFAVSNDIGRKQYWRIEKGSNITLETLFQILDILDISVDDFFSSIDF